MRVKFYNIKKPENLYQDEQYLFDAFMSMPPRKDELIFTEEKSYRVFDICYSMYPSDGAIYECDNVCVSVIEEE